ncbi:MAG TPA: AMP-binding protein [Streptosporangiaceae bacterium]|jgi:fatty-acyl-CoA synthase
MTTGTGDGATSVGVVLAAFAGSRDRPAITHAGATWTYGDLLDRIHRTARALRASGLRRGDVLAVLTGNRPETYVLRYAAHALGCATTILYDGLAPALLARMLHTTGAATLVFDPGPYDGLVRAAAAEAPGVALLAYGVSDLAPDLAARAAAESAEPVEVRARPGDLASIRLTGGSTGAPKGVPRDFRVPGYLTPPALAAWRDATQLLCTPIGHLGGTLAEVVLAAGGRVVLHERFDAGAVLAAIAAERVTFVWLPPRLLYALLDHPDLPATDTSSLRSIACGGSGGSPSRMAQAVERFGPIVAQGYGTLEANQITWLSTEEHLRPELLSTVGRPVGSVTVSIRDSSGAPVGTGTTGEIWVRGPSVVVAYHRQPDRTAEAMRDGWFRTGDLGFLDSAGYLTIAGRVTDVIIAAEGHVYPSAIEDVLHAHPAIGAAAVFGVAGPDGEEHVGAAVVPAPGARLDAETVVAWVRDHRGAAYAPEIVLVLDALPLTGSQKPDRTELRRRAAERLPRR